MDEREKQKHNGYIIITIYKWYVYRANLTLNNTKKPTTKETKKKNIEPESVAHKYEREKRLSCAQMRKIWWYYYRLEQMGKKRARVVAIDG